MNTVCCFCCKDAPKKKQRLELQSLHGRLDAHQQEGQAAMLNKISKVLVTVADEA